MLEDLGVPRTRVRILRFFAEGGELEIGVRELARALHLNAGNAQRELAKLSRLGYLNRVERREPDGDYERQTLIYTKNKRLTELAEKIDL